MSLQSVRVRYLKLLNSIGKAALHANFPDDFEYYSCSFELVDSKGDIVDMLVFPVMPSEMSINEKPIVNIKKANSTVSSLYNSTFTPFDINIGGNFGRKFKILVGNQFFDGAAFRLKTKLGGSEFNTQIKTGYGVTKILERIIKDSRKFDNTGKPMKLFFHNPAFNHSHLVEVLNLSFRQDEGRNNMIWRYDVSMKALAPSLGLIEESENSSLKRLMKFNLLSKGLNSLVGEGMEQIYKQRQQLIR